MTAAISMPVRRPSAVASGPAISEPKKQPHRAMPTALPVMALRAISLSSWRGCTKL